MIRGASVHSLAKDSSQLSQDERNVALHLARATRDVAAGAQLLRYGANFHFEKNLPRNMPRLIYACTYDPLAAEMIIDGGVDYLEDTHPTSKSTALLEACAAGHTDLVQYLISNGANTLAVDKTGSGALLYAIRHEHPDIVTVLLQAGVAVDSQDRDGLTPVMEASRYLQYDILNQLIDTGADVNVCTRDGKSAMTFAALQNASYCQDPNGNSGCFSFLSKSSKRSSTSFSRRRGSNKAKRPGDTSQSRDLCVESLLQAGASAPAFT